MGHEKLLRCLAFSLLGVAIWGCAYQYGSGILPRADSAGTFPYGAYVEVKEGAREFEGELIATTGDSIFVATRSGLQASYRDRCVVRGSTFDRGTIAGQYVGLTFLGIIGSISAGAPGIVILVPLYLIAGIASAVTVSGISAITYSPSDRSNVTEWKELAKWSRFPFGLPPDLDRSQVTMFAPPKLTPAK